MQSRVIAGRYRLEVQVGQGVLGTLWRAEDLSLGRPVAARLLPTDANVAHDVFERNAKLAAGLQSVHAALLLDHGEDQGESFAVTAWLEGESLRERLASCGRLGLEDTLRLVSEVGQALGEAHEAGLVHGNLKPSNIFIAKGEGEAVELCKVLDLGLAEVVLAGTGSERDPAMLPYASPESAQAGTKLDQRADLWTLAVVCFECLTGKLPPPVVGGAADGEAPAPSRLCPEAELPAELDAWMARAFSPRADARFQSARELSDSLRAAAGQPQGDRAPESASSVDSRPSIQDRPPVSQAAWTAVLAAARRSGAAAAALPPPEVAFQPPPSNPSLRSMGAGSLPGAADSAPGRVRRELPPPRSSREPLSSSRGAASDQAIPSERPSDRALRSGRPNSRSLAGPRSPVRRYAYLGVALAVVSIAVAGVLLFRRAQGSELTVQVTREGMPYGDAQIYIDGQKRCDAAPCVIEGLTPGLKLIRVVDGANAVEQQTTIEAGQKHQVVVALRSGSHPAASRPSAEEPRVGGLRLSSEQTGVKVLVDGQERGSLPLELRELPPGTLKLRFVNEPDYQPLERSVEVKAGQLTELGQITLMAREVEVRFVLVTAGTEVELASDREPEKAQTLKLRVGKDLVRKLDATAHWTVLARKHGLRDWSTDLSFADGKTSQTVRIELEAPGAAAPTPRPSGEPSAAPTADAEASTAMGTLNVNSVPPSRALVDGRPVGTTPAVVQVPAGSHTVVFIHKDLGRQAVSVTVGPGETKVAAVRFQKTD